MKFRMSDDQADNDIDTYGQPTTNKDGGVFVQNAGAAQVWIHIQAQVQKMLRT